MDSEIEASLGYKVRLKIDKILLENNCGLGSMSQRGCVESLRGKEEMAMIED